MSSIWSAADEATPWLKADYATIGVAPQMRTTVSCGGTFAITFALCTLVLLCLRPPFVCNRHQEVSISSVVAWSTLFACVAMCMPFALTHRHAYTIACSFM